MNDVRRSQIWVVQCGTLVALVCATALVAAQDQRKRFEQDWEKQTVVLRQPLYSISFAGATEGTVIATPDRVYFECEAGSPSNVQRDSSIDRLLGKVAGQLRRVEPQLLTFEAGTPLYIHAVHIARGWGGARNRRVVFEFLDEFAERDGRWNWIRPVTTLTIELPEKISSAFTERAQVEEILARYLERQP